MFHAANILAWMKRFIARSMVLCWCAMIAAVYCHFSKAIDRSLFIIRRIAPPSSYCSRFIAAASACHFSKAIDS